MVKLFLKQAVAWTGNLKETEDIEIKLDIVMAAVLSLLLRRCFGTVFHNMLGMQNR